jgi:hypothetical protein
MLTKKRFIFLEIPVVETTYNSLMLFAAEKSKPRIRINVRAWYFDRKKIETAV